MPWWKRIQHLLFRQRRRLATMFLFVGVALLAQRLAGAWPREREIRYALESDLQACQIARFDYRDGDETLSRLELRFPEGAPAQVVHRPTLAVGRYDVTIDLTFPGGSVTRAEQVVDVPLDGVMELSLRADHFR